MFARTSGYLGRAVFLQSLTLLAINLEISVAKGTSEHPGAVLWEVQGLRGGFQRDWEGNRRSEEDKRVKGGQAGCLRERE